MSSNVLHEECRKDLRDGMLENAKWFYGIQRFSSLEREQSLSICHLWKEWNVCAIKTSYILHSLSHRANIIASISTRQFTPGVYISSCLSYIRYTLSPFVLRISYTIQVVVVSECIEIRDESRVLLVMLARLVAAAHDRAPLSSHPPYPDERDLASR